MNKLFRQIRYDKRLWLVAVIVAFILLQFPMFSPVRDAFRTAVSLPATAFNRVSTFISSNYSSLKNISTLSRENATLRESNAQLLADLAAREFVERENEQLRIDLGFSQSRTELKLKPATVLFYSPTGSTQAITIDIGEKDGVIVDQVAIVSGSLLGKVKKVSAQTSEVWPITNRSIVIPILLPNSQQTAILRGGIRGLMVENIPSDSQIQIGDKIVTSALEGQYPPGLLVGRVEEIIKNDAAVFYSARVSSQINFGAISNLYVIQ